MGKPKYKRSKNEYVELRFSVPLWLREEIDKRAKEVELSRKKYVLMILMDYIDKNESKINRKEGHLQKIKNFINEVENQYDLPLHNLFNDMVKMNNSITKALLDNHNKTKKLNKVCLLAKKLIEMYDIDPMIKDYGDEYDKEIIELFEALKEAIKNVYKE